MTAALHPAGAAAQLGISTATLRRWSQQISHLLSPAAGNPADRGRGQRAHRRYSPADVQTLAAFGKLLAAGLSYEQARNRLAEQEGGVSALLLAPAADRSAGEVEIAHFVSDTLHSLANSQEIVLSNQQMARQLLGVVLQDNFNLKEENARLRERMLETERTLFELKRELDAGRSQERERMRQMEAQLFEMQRRFDGMVMNQSSVRTPAPLVMAASLPLPTPPAPPPAETAAPPLAPPPATTDPARRRSLWDRLLGR